MTTSTNVHTRAPTVASQAVLQALTIAYCRVSACASTRESAQYSSQWEQRASTRGSMAARVVRQPRGQRRRRKPRRRKRETKRQQEARKKENAWREAQWDNSPFYMKPAAQERMEMLARRAEATLKTIDPTVGTLLDK